jgi:hypothetical protein
MSEESGTPEGGARQIGRLPALVLVWSVVRSGIVIGLTLLMLLFLVAAVVTVWWEVLILVVGVPVWTVGGAHLVRREQERQIARLK